MLLHVKQQTGDTNGLLAFLAVHQAEVAQLRTILRRITGPLMTQDALHPAVDPLAVCEKAPLVQKLLLHIWMNAAIHLVFAYGQLPIEGKNLPRQLPRETIEVGKITNLSWNTKIKTVGCMGTAAIEAETVFNPAPRVLAP